MNFQFDRVYKLLLEDYLKDVDKNSFRVFVGTDA